MYVVTQKASGPDLLLIFVHDFTQVVITETVDEVLKERVVEVVPVLTELLPHHVHCDVTLQVILQTLKEGSVLIPHLQANMHAHVFSLIRTIDEPCLDVTLRKGIGGMDLDQVPHLLIVKSPERKSFLEQSIDEPCLDVTPRKGVTGTREWD